MLRRRLSINDPRGGQFVILYIFGLFTLCLIAFTSLTVGQMMIRKQWAQLIADAGAYAGAAKEAEGLNTISRITGFQFTLLRWIQWRDRQLGYMVSSWKKECTKALPGKYAKKIQKRHKNLENVWFKPANWAVDGVNLGYRALACSKANEVAEENFKRFFPAEWAAHPSSFKTPDTLAYVPIKLTKLTDYFDESVAWFYWTPDPGPEPVFPGLLCSIASYMMCDLSGIAGRIGTGDHADQPDDKRPKSSYHFTQVMRLMEKDSETTFLYWVQIPAVRPILGMDRILGHIPPITAIARAKPFLGNLGFNDEEDLNDANDLWPKREVIIYGWIPWDPPPTAVPTGPAGWPYTWNVQWRMSKRALQTYRVKFVPVLPIRSREDLPVLLDLVVRVDTDWKHFWDYLGISH